jgi:hypothetical protein
VLSLPILVILFASIMAIGLASLEKSGVAIQVRNEAWQRRWSADSGQEQQYLNEATGRMPLSGVTIGAALSGEIHLTQSHDFSVPAWMGGSATATSGNSVLMGSWDYHEVPGFQESAPHFNVLVEIAADTMQGVEAITQILHP